MTFPDDHFPPVTAETVGRLQREVDDLEAELADTRKWLNIWKKRYEEMKKESG